MPLWPLALGFLIFGLVGLRLGWTLFVEYRGVFFGDPQRTMSLEVLFRLVGFGGPGYFAALALILGSASALLGLVLLLIPLVYSRFFQMLLRHVL